MRASVNYTTAWGSVSWGGAGSDIAWVFPQPFANTDYTVSIDVNHGGTFQIAIPMGKNVSQQNIRPLRLSTTGLPASVPDVIFECIAIGRWLD